MLLILAFTLMAGDLDRDGLSDKLEDKLLKQFRPTLLLDAQECDGRPAEFAKGVTHAVPGAKNGTLYGQVFRTGTNLEIHYYHLWANDCGRGSHPLDAEHVAVLLEPIGKDWQAIAWIAAGHDGTLCDRRHGASAMALNAIRKGATVWVSHGKHASFLSQSNCSGGCGADRCERPVTMPPGKLINVGEAQAPYPGYQWIQTRVGGFHLAAKMTSEFAESDLAAMRKQNKLVSLTPIPRPAQAFLLGGNTAGDAIVIGNKHTEAALTKATEHVDRALATSYDKVRRWFKRF